MELKRDEEDSRGDRAAKASLYPASREYEFDAMIFDLDGVITSTATLHFDGWKVTFDKMMASLKASHLLAHDAPEEFTEKHYLDYVDGKPRYDGVRSFIDALGNGENWLGAKMAGQVRDDATSSIHHSTFIQFIASSIQADAHSLSIPITPENLDEMIDQWSHDPEKLGELLDQCAIHPQHLELLLKTLAKRPLVLGDIIVRRVGDIKDKWINDKLNDDSVDIVKFQHTLDMIRAAKQKGIHIGIASSE